MTAFGRHLRARAALYALLVAACQLSLAAGASTIMLASTPPGASTVAEDDCSCEHSAAVMCPMHRRPASRPIPPGTPRWCGAGDDSVFALLPVLGALTVPEPVQGILEPSSVPLTLSRTAVHPVRLAHPPDSPPPRA